MDPPHLFALQTVVAFAYLLVDPGRRPTKRRRSGFSPALNSGRRRTRFRFSTPSILPTREFLSEYPVVPGLLEGHTPSPALTSVP